MKHLLFILWAISLMVHAQMPEIFPELRTLDGKVFKQVKVTKSDAAEIRIAHAEGFAVIPLSKLPPEVLALFGGKTSLMAEQAVQSVRRTNSSYSVVPSAPTASFTPSAATAAPAAATITLQENARRASEWYQWCLANPQGDAQVSQAQRNALLAQSMEVLQAWQQQSQAKPVAVQNGPLSTRPAIPVGRSANDPERIAEQMARRARQQQSTGVDWSIWHSVLADVCHTHPHCTTGNNIERENLRPGHGGRALCQECAKLIQLNQMGVVTQQTAQEQGGSAPQGGYWHSSQQGVSHAHPRCTTGNNIERGYLQSGTGNKPLCQECARLFGIQR